VRKRLDFAFVPRVVRNDENDQRAKRLGYLAKFMACEDSSISLTDLRQFSETATRYVERTKKLVSKLKKIKQDQGLSSDERKAAKLLRYINEMVGMLKVPVFSSGSLNLLSLFQTGVRDVTEVFAEDYFDRAFQQTMNQFLEIEPNFTTICSRCDIVSAEDNVEGILRGIRSQSVVRIEESKQGDMAHFCDFYGKPLKTEEDKRRDMEDEQLLPAKRGLNGSMMAAIADRLAPKKITIEQMAKEDLEEDRAFYDEIPHRMVHLINERAAAVMSNDNAKLIDVNNKMDELAHDYAKTKFKRSSSFKMLETLVHERALMGMFVGLGEGDAPMSVSELPRIGSLGVPLRALSAFDKLLDMFPEGDMERERWLNAVRYTIDYLFYKARGIPKNLLHKENAGMSIESLATYAAFKRRKETPEALDLLSRSLLFISLAEDFQMTIKHPLDISDSFASSNLQWLPKSDLIKVRGFVSIHGNGLYERTSQFERSETI